MDTLNNRRTTRQRASIREVVMAAGRPLLPAEILENAQAEIPGISLATVYRNIKLLVEDGELQSVDLPGESPRFEAADAEHHHHHHFQCRVCQKVFDVHGCPENLQQLAPAGFTVERHELTLYGVCENCAPKTARAPAKGK